MILQMEGSCFEIQTVCDAFQLGNWKLWLLSSPWVLIFPEPNQNLRGGGKGRDRDMPGLQGRTSLSLYCLPLMLSQITHKLLALLRVSNSFVGAVATML